MKIKYYCLLGILLPMLSMCRNTEEKKKMKAELLPTPLQECYLAIDGKDSAFLKIYSGKSKVITGDLLIQYSGRPANDGHFTGRFQGDTLFVNYRFHTGNEMKTIFTNPLAFYRRSDSLILGTGRIRKNLGRVYLDKKQGVDFAKGRFRFVKVFCENELRGLSLK